MSERFFSHIFMWVIAPLVGAFMIGLVGAMVVCLMDAASDAPQAVCCDNE